MVDFLAGLTIGQWLTLGGLIGLLVGVVIPVGWQVLTGTFGPKTYELMLWGAGVFLAIMIIGTIAMLKGA